MTTFIRETDAHWRLPLVITQANAGIAYLDECAEGLDELSWTGYENRACEARATRDLLMEAAKALRLCAVELRHSLHDTLMASTTLATSAGGTEWEPAGLVDAEDAQFIGPIIAAIRAAQDIVGRPQDDQPAWLDDIIDGRRPWAQEDS